ncbi:hypothetical protein PUNSTDRAFT_50881, partial [Punctularia strigosozonata HHB-11173 SS5]|uniref:uncharacterized protein n=1 Tax=Punctularia strigosozonata (strain HHB-11173) TaxID=741275 RepID=UPI00044176E1
MTFEESDFGLHLDSYPVDQHPAIFNHTIALRKILDFAQQLAGCSPGAVLNFAERSGAPLYRYIGQLSRLLIIVQRVQDFAPRDLSLRSHVATHASMNEMLDHILAMCATFGATLETAAPPTRGTHYLPRISMLCDPTEYRWLPLVARLGITHRQAI